MESSLGQFILWQSTDSLSKSDSNRSVADDDVRGTFQCGTYVVLIETVVLVESQWTFTELAYLVVHIRQCEQCHI